MVFRSQFLYSGLVASAAILLLLCLNWQCLLFVFLIGGIGWGLWAVSGGVWSGSGAGGVKVSGDAALRNIKLGGRGHAGSRPRRVSRPSQSQSRLYQFPDRVWSNKAAK